MKVMVVGEPTNDAEFAHGIKILKWLNSAGLKVYKLEFKQE